MKANLAKAKRAFGKNADVLKRYYSGDNGDQKCFFHPKGCPGKIPVWKIGIRVEEFFNYFRVLGTGSTFDEAMENAVKHGQLWLDKSSKKDNS